MATSSFRSKTLLLLFAATLALPAASPAAPRRAQAPRAAALAQLSLLDRAWNALQSLWSETGCKLDPNGRCLTDTPQVPQPTPHLDEGCKLDPNGRCAAGTTRVPQPTPHLDEGCMLDPSGRCHS